MPLLLHICRFVAMSSIAVRPYSDAMLWQHVNHAINLLQRYIELVIVESPYLHPN